MRPNYARPKSDLTSQLRFRAFADGTTTETKGSSIVITQTFPLAFDGTADCSGGDARFSAEQDLSHTTLINL